MIKKLQSNWKSGFTIALVSIPLSLSLAVASHVSPVQGIITAVWAGALAALFGGSNYNIIGPTGALSGIIATFVLTQGIESVGLLAVVVGIMVLIAYALHFERYLIFIPSSVLHGFTLGVALIIALNQFNFACGLSHLPSHPELFSNLWESLTHLSLFSWPALIVFCISLLTLFELRIFVKGIPGLIILSPLGIIFGYFWSAFFHLETLSSRYGTLTFTLFKMPSFFLIKSVFWPAFIISLVAILETMLSARIADTLTKTKHESSKELLGLGIANIGSGLMGGIPATAALARTVLNIKSGATDRCSALWSSAFIVLLSLVCLPFFGFMPMAVIAAILVNVAINMIEREHFVRLWRHDKINCMVALFVAFMTLYKDPVIGILGGALLSLLFFVEKLSHGYYELTIRAGAVSQDNAHDGEKKENVLIYRFKGKLSYLNIHAHAVRFEKDFVHFNHIILDFAEVYFIDIDGIDIIDEIIEFGHKKSKKILIASLSPLLRTTLHTISPHFKELENKSLVFKTVEQAETFFNK